jgi:hypothetical protein
LCALGVFDGCGHSDDYPIEVVDLVYCSFSMSCSHASQLNSLSLFIFTI